MPVYRSRRFGVLVTSSFVVGILILAVTIMGISSFFPIRRVVAYYQLVDYDNLPTGKPIPAIWARINHTVLILNDSIIESIFTATVIDIPYYQDAMIKMSFDDPGTLTTDDPVPQVLEGNQSWYGRSEEDLQVNQTITIYTKVTFDFDAKYSLNGQVLNYDNATGNGEGYGTVYYVTVEQGKIVKITDRAGQTPPSTTLETKKIG